MYDDQDQAMWQGSSVNLEPGDLFVIISGEMIHPGGMTVFGTKVPPKYDDKFEGVVFEALEVCGTMVAIKARFPHHHIDRTLSMNIAGLETMTVTPRYLEELLKGRDESQEAEEQMKQMQEQGQGGQSLMDFLRQAGQAGPPGAGMGNLPKGFIIGPMPSPDEDGPTFPGNMPDNLPGFSPDEDDEEPTEE